ncbi:MAG: DUF1330 domain-containing protein [Pseudomonadota bacterium]
MRTLFSSLCCMYILASGAVYAQGSSAPRPGYMIVLTEDVDPAGMRDYAKIAVPLLLQYKAKLLFATPEGKNEVLEGGSFKPSVRVFEFPSLEAARGYYNSDIYQSAIPLREGNGKVTVLLSDAFVPDPKWTKAPQN